MSNPVAEAAQRAWAGVTTDTKASPAAVVESAAHEALQPIRECMARIRGRYDQVKERMLSAESSAEMSRHANEMAGLDFAYSLLVPLVYSSDELAAPR